MGAKAIAVEAAHEVGVIFQGASVRGIFAGTKTQTRRLRGIEPGKLRVRLPYEVKSDLADLMPAWRGVVGKPGIRAAELNPQGAVAVRVGNKLLGLKPGEFDFVCPYAEGTTRLVEGNWRIEPHGSQRIWVREAFAVGSRPRQIFYKASRLPGHANTLRWRSSLFMARAASRLTLEITEVRVQRLQDISEEDAKAEGVEPAEYHPTRPYAQRFSRTWDVINGGRAPWANNPWVWAISFRRLA